MTDHATTEPPSEAQEIARLAPEKLVAGFTHTPVGRFTLIAILLHVVVILGSSIPFIYDTWINPEAAAARAAQVEAQRQAEQDAQLKAAASADEEAPPAEAAADDTAAEEDAGAKSRIEQRIEETADPDEMPSLDELLIENP